MKKYIVAAAVAILVFSVAAFAASLSVNAGTLQAGQDQIDQCTESDVTVSYGTATFTNPGWTIDTITLDDQGACDGYSFSVAVTGGPGTPPWTTNTESGTFGTSPVTVTFDVGFDAEEASDVHLVIRNATSTP